MLASRLCYQALSRMQGSKKGAKLSEQSEALATGVVRPALTEALSVNACLLGHGEDDKKG